MTRTHPAALIAFALALAGSPAFAASPRFVFDPIETQARSCRALGPAWDRKVVETLRLARAQTARLLPSTSWDELITAAPDAVVARPEVARCEAFVAATADPKLSNRIRATFLFGNLVKAVAGCAEAFPESAAAVRAAWVAAFTRNDLDPMTDAFDISLRTNWRKPSDDAQQRQDCDGTLHLLESKEFDQMAGEEHLSRLLSGR
jgi:hypothetical protein